MRKAWFLDNRDHPLVEVPIWFRWTSWMVVAGFLGIIVYAFS